MRIVGGGVAGVETALALADLAPAFAEVSVITPDPDFIYKPMIIAEPFTGEPARQLELAPLLAGVGTSVIRGTLEHVDLANRAVALGEGSELSYDLLVICIGGLPRPAYDAAETFWAGSSDLAVDRLIDRASQPSGGVLHFVVPPGTTWSLPVYELALMFRHRAIELGSSDLRIRVMTPEEGPLMIFGRPASDAVAQLLADRRIEVQTGVAVVDDRSEAPSGLRTEALPASGPSVALPSIEGPRVQGLPADARGFIPIDSHCRVAGAADVYAAGDGTSFPIKQGGIATQQADAAATHIAARLGADVEPEAFTPVLRGTLLTASESLHLRHRIAGGGGEGVAAIEHLWWPPGKISGRYLSAALSGSISHPDFDRSLRPLEVEVSWPHEWHAQPLFSSGDRTDEGR